MWMKVTREFPHASQDTNASIEAYHNVMKKKQALSKKTLRSKRLDWLIWFLTGELAGHYWYLDLLKSKGIIRNEYKDKFINKVVSRALEIHPSDVTTVHGGDHVIVFDRSHGNDVSYVVTGAGSEWADCNCPKDGQVNLCKHIVRVFQFLSGASNEQLVQICHNYFDSFFGGTWELPLDLPASETSGLMCFPEIDDKREDIVQKRHVEPHVTCAPPSGLHVDVSRQIACEMKKLEEMAGSNTILQNHLLSGIMDLQGRILQLRATLAEEIHNPCDPLVSLTGTSNSQKRLKPLCEHVLGRPQKSRKKD